MASKSQVKSPAQSVPLRSPMEKHIPTSSRSSSRLAAAAIEIVDSDEEMKIEGGGKISFSSPTSSKAGGSRSTTPSKASGSVKSRISASKSATAAKKRKVEDLETKESDIIASLEKLRNESKKVKAKISRMEEEAMKVKFPMKDEVLMSLCNNIIDTKNAKTIKNDNKASTTTTSTGAKNIAMKLDPLKNIPPAVLQLNTMLSEDLVTDAIGVWDFLNVFSKTLSITSITWENFIELLKYTDKPSLALTDLYCSLLRLILSDTSILAKISIYLPKKVNYAYRHNGEFELNPTGEVDFNMSDLLLQDDYDCEYNGLKLLPRKIKLENVNSLCYQAILRSVLLRLEPVKQLRKAVLDITNVAHYEYVHNSTSTSVATPGAVKTEGEDGRSSDVGEYEEIGVLVGLASAYKRQRTRTPAPKHPTTTTAPSTAIKSSPTDNNTMEIKEEKERIPPQTTQKIIPTSLLASINTPKLSKTKQQQSTTKNMNSIDKDAIYHITSNVTSSLQNIYQTANLLETTEIYQLPIQYKLCILKVLCDTALETSRIKQLLKKNAEERYIQITQMNKSIKEIKLKQKEINNNKKDAAFQLCRENNILKAKIEEEKLILLEKKKAASALKSAKKKKGATPEKAKDNKTKKGKSSTTTTSTTTPMKKGNNKGTKGAKKETKSSIGVGKDGLDPTPDQLAAMIEEMVILSAFGVDFVEEIPLDLLENSTGGSGSSSTGDDSDDSEEFEYDKKGNLIQRTKRQRRTTALTRVQALDRKKAHAEKRYKQEVIQLAEERLVRSLEVNSEREMRAAIKQAERSGCKDYKDNGKCFCTPNMKAVYVKLYELETQAKEDKLASQHERALQEYFVRTTPIGTDRYHNTYWSFVGDDRLFVQSREQLSDAELEHCPMPPQSGSECDPTLSRLFSSRPNRFRYKWSVYSSPTEQWLLWDALDDRGERERALKAAVKARFEIEEPPIIYELTGSEFIGRKVRRVFGRKKPVIGLIVGWLPPTATDAALWHVQHLDGDEEDLDEEEVEEFLLPLEDTSAGTSADSGAMDVFEDQPMVGAEKATARDSTVTASALVKKESSASLASTGKQANITSSIVRKKNTTEEVDSDAEAEFDEEEQVVLPTMPKEDVPSIVCQSAGLTRGIPAWRAAPLTNQLGAQAMRTELTRVLGLLNDEIKARGGGFTRETRKMWDHTLRDAETVVDFIGPVLELESLVRDLQTAEDKRDAEEVRLAKEAEKAEMMKEGWVFEPEASEFIGIQARRFFKGFGSSDGTVIAHLPADKNDGVALWHMEHNDGDAEDLELEDLQKALRYFEQDLQEDEEDDESEGEEERDDESSVSSEESDEEDAGAEDRLYAPNRSGATLWPTYEVRQRWMAALSSSKTMSELGLALQGFMEQADAFGVLAPDPFAVEKELAPRKARLAARSARRSMYVEEDSPPDSTVAKRSSSRHHRSSSRHQQQAEMYGRDSRPSRAAARSVRSYAE